MIVTLSIIFFWAAVGLVFYSYVIYPQLIIAMSNGRSLPYKTYPSTHDSLPTAYILLAVYNGEKAIIQKLTSTLRSSYPSHLIHILVGSDESTDNTDQLVADIAKDDARVKLYKYSRRGKANVLNQLVAELQQYRTTASDVVIYTDVHAMFDPDTIYECVKYLADSRVGIIGATYIHTNNSTAEISAQEKAYINRENNIKYAESVTFGAMMGVYGACFAIRLNDIPRFPDNILAEDFYITLWQLARNKKSILNLAAKFYLNNPNSIEIEYHRKRRISAGNFQNLVAFTSLLLPRLNGVALCYWSHKVIRWLSPFFIIISSLSLLCLQVLSYEWYPLLAIFCELIFLLVLSDVFLQRVSVQIKVIRFGYYFLQMNFALLDGFFWYCRGVKSNIWKPTTRIV